MLGEQESIIMPDTKLSTKIDNPKIHEIFDMSGGVQTMTSPFLNRKTELQGAINAVTTKLGGLTKVPGYVQKGDDLTSTTSTSTSTSTTSTSTSTSTTTSTSTSTTTTA